MMSELASTRDVLGEHLYQKIKELEWIPPGFESDSETRIISRITGILLERPLEDIFKMLTEKSVLQNNIQIAADSVEDKRIWNSKPVLDFCCTGSLLSTEKVFGNDKLENDTAFDGTFDKVKSCLHPNESDPVLTDDQISLMIYEHVQSVHEADAPKITGMILELDSATLRQFIDDKNSLDEAIAKAYNVLKSNNTS